MVIQFYIKSEEQQPRGMSRYYTLVVNKFTAEPLKHDITVYCRTFNKMSIQFNENMFLKTGRSLFLFFNSFIHFNFIFFLMVYVEKTIFNLILYRSIACKVKLNELFG